MWNRQAAGYQEYYRQSGLGNEALEVCVCSSVAAIMYRILAMSGASTCSRAELCPTVDRRKLPGRHIAMAVPGAHRDGTILESCVAAARII
jgi:hypothetical protein